MPGWTVWLIVASFQPVVDEDSGAAVNSCERGWSYSCASWTASVRVDPAAAVVTFTAILLKEVAVGTHRAANHMSLAAKIVIVAVACGSRGLV
jgi:hypothetical protein